MPGGIPICVYDSKIRMFRVLHSKGKSVVSGGYGVSFSEREETSTGQQEQSLEHDQKRMRLAKEETEDATETNDQSANKDNANISTSAAVSSEYLFMEEALFLYERGLIEVYDENNNVSLDSSQMFEILKEKSDVSLPVYLVYKHLRVQTFVVVRHTPKRLELVNRLAQAEKSSCLLSTEPSSTTTGSTQQKGSAQKSWKKRRKTSGIQKATRDLREDARNAPAPIMVDGSFDDTDASIAFDVYKPNSEFRKTNPGPPDFYVSITSFSKPSPLVGQLHELIRSCRGIGLRIATVADSGSVIMFGVTDFGVPTTDKEKKIDR